MIVVWIGHRRVPGTARRGQGTLKWRKVTFTPWPRFTAKTLRAELAALPYLRGAVTGRLGLITIIAATGKRGTLAASLDADGQPAVAAVLRRVARKASMW